MKIVPIGGRAGAANGHIYERKAGAREISAKDAGVTVNCLIGRRELWHIAY
jgi:hypothetical protein